MRSGVIAFLSGILALQGLAELPELHWLLIICLILCIGIYRQGKPFTLLIWLLLGFGWAWLHAWYLLDKALPAQVEGKNVELSGYIATIPIQRDRLSRFMFDVESAHFNGKILQLPGKLRLNWYGASPKLLVGDKWRLVVRLQRPHGFINPGGFDYEQWLFSQRIGATGYVRSKEGYTLLASHWSDYPLQRLRHGLLQKIERRLAGQPMQGIVSALILGHREQISQQQWQVFRQTGTNHLVAISGLHIGLVAGLVFFLVRLGWSRLGNLPLYLPAPQAAAVLAFLCAMAYAALAGWSLPTQRALIMIGVVMLALSLKRHVLPSYALSLALLLVLLHDPMAVMSPGFWLSFGAVGLIFLAMQGKRNGVPWWDKWFRVQWVVGLGLLPILLLFFQQGSLISPLANFIAVPVVSLMVVPILLGAVLLGVFSAALGQILLETGAWVLQQLYSLLAMLGASPYALWTGISPDMGVLLSAGLGVLILLFGPIRTGRWLGLVCLLPLLFYQVKRPAEGEVYFTLLDVGQGLSAVIQTQGHALVFDTGPRFSDYFDTGSAVLLPFLRQQQIRELDVLLVSHGDNDHIGGAQSLLQGMPVKRIYSSAPRMLQNPIASACQRGMQWQWDGVIFRILHPDHARLDKKENNQSCVLHVKSRHGSILLPGDIEREAEYQLLAASPGDIRADILVAPHHGSKTSSSRAFIAAINPTIVLYPVGYRNRYHFPYPKVMQRYAERGVRAFDTARHGAIQFQLGEAGTPTEPNRLRQSMQAYWHHRVTD